LKGKFWLLYRWKIQIKTKHLFLNAGRLGCWICSCEDDPLSVEATASGDIFLGIVAITWMPNRSRKGWSSYWMLWSAALLLQGN
jgi:hypothetical protein